MANTLGFKLQHLAQKKANILECTNIPHCLNSSCGVDHLWRETEMKDNEKGIHNYLGKITDAGNKIGFIG